MMKSKYKDAMNKIVNTSIYTCYNLYIYIYAIKNDMRSLIHVHIHAHVHVDLIKINKYIFLS